MKFVTEEIGDTFKEWKAGDSVLLTYPTGAGKTTFVLKSLLPFAVQQEKHVIFICNRKILEKQFSVDSGKELSEFFGDAEDIPASYLASLHIVTYQYCERMNRIPYLEGDNGERIVEKDVLYYIFDEAHYFMSDSQFNSETDCWMTKFSDAPLKNFSHSIMIYMTATPEPLMRYLAACSSKFKLGEQIQRIKRCHYDEEDILTGRLIAPYVETLKQLDTCKENLNLKIYSASERTTIYGLFSVKYFRNYEELLPLLLSASSDNQWLVFVDNEKEGYALCTVLKNYSMHAVFLSAKTRYRQGEAKAEFEAIVNTGKFDTPVLIATSVMDCGVSIKAKSVNHIVIANHNKTTFLQMLGRRRILSSEETISLYIKEYTARTINGICHTTDLKLKYLVDFELMNKEEPFESKNGWSEEDDGMRYKPFLKEWEIKALFSKIRYYGALLHCQIPRYESRYPSYSDIEKFKQGKWGRLKEANINRSAFVDLLYELECYVKAYASYKNDNGEADDQFYLKEQLSWIDHEYDECNWIGYAESREDTVAFLDNELGKWLDKKAQITFRKELLNRFKKMPVQPTTMKQYLSKYNESCDPGIKKLNQALLEKNLPYLIISKQKMINGCRSTYWRVQRREANKIHCG